MASPKLFPNTVSTAPPRQVQPEHAAPVAVVSQRDLVTRFVQKDLSRMSPDEVAQHFASVSQLERVTFPERLSLESHTPNEALTVAYALAPDGSWRFVAADLGLRAAERAASEATFREAEKELRKLGKPKAQNDGLVWKRPNRQELRLAQLEPAQADGTWEVALQLASQAP
ncbi:MAG TPA: hypothetical protein VJR89_18010 [Polyangiales bacterium]|nr:hypothetical protein [Polyangiales bacterium]